jgi:hypothetical protein
MLWRWLNRLNGMIFFSNYMKLFSPLGAPRPPIPHPRASRPPAAAPRPPSLVASHLKQISRRAMLLFSHLQSHSLLSAPGAARGAVYSILMIGPKTSSPFKVS